MCTIEVEVEDGRAVKLRGSKDDPVTKGFLCERTTRFLYRQYSPERITQPLARKNGALVPVSWDEALDLAAERLTRFRDRFGPESILHYRSGGSMGMLKQLADYLFELFGPVTVKHGDICSGAGEAAQETDFGLCDSSDLEDLYNSRLIVNWGRNLHTSWAHLLPVVTEARRRGAKIVGIDPVRTRTASLCDTFLQPRPGADACVAFAIARHLFEQGLADPQACDNLEAFRELAYRRTFSEWARRADLPEEALKELAELYGTTRPAAILVGWGLGRRLNGSATVRALDALGAISGNLGVPGGGVGFYFQRRSAFDCGFVTGKKARSLSEACLGRELLTADPPVRMIWVTAGNPVAMLPEADSVRAGFEKADFVVVVDTHPNDTTDCADLVLPTLTMLEDDDLLGAYGNHYLRESRPALEPPGEARHELAILQGLAERLGLAEPLAGTPAEWKQRMMHRLSEAGVTLESLPARNPFAPHVAFEGRRFPTATGRVNLLTELPQDPPEQDPEYPLTLLAVATPKAQSSQWSVPVPELPEVRVHPSCGLSDGAPAWLESRLDSLKVTVRLDETARPDVALMAKGGQRRNGWCANRLVRARETDAGGGAAYYDEPVRLRTRKPDAAPTGGNGRPAG